MMTLDISSSPVLWILTRHTGKDEGLEQRVTIHQWLPRGEMNKIVMKVLCTGMET